MLPVQTNKFAFLFGPIAKMLLAIILGCLIIWTIGYLARFNPETREKAFQSQLAECERLVELNGNDWRLKLGLDHTCVAVFEEYSRRIDEEEKRQDTDKAEKQGINDSAGPEPPDTE